MQAEAYKNLIITGSNRGLGFALANLILSKSLSLNIVLTARDPEAFQPKLQGLQQKYPSARLFLHQLDVANTESVKTFAKWFGDTHKTVDYLVNNAGYGLRPDFFRTDVPSVEIASNTLASNVYGLIQNTEAFKPLLAADGRIINVSSCMGTLDKHAPNIREKLLNPALTTADIIALTRDYEEQIKRGSLDGWGLSAYTVSKSLVTAYTRFCLKKELKEGQKAIALHPGWCRTTMGGPTATFSEEDGAALVYFATFEAGEEANFKFLVDGKVFEEKL